MCVGCASVWGVCVCVCARASGRECCTGAWTVSVRVWGLSVRCARVCVVIRATCEHGGLCSRCELTFPFLKFLPFIEHVYLASESIPVEHFTGKWLDITHSCQAWRHPLSAQQKHILSY